MKTWKRLSAPLFLAIAAVAAFGASSLTLWAQDTSIQTPVYRMRNSGIGRDQGGGFDVYSKRVRTTIASVNTGATLLPAISGYKYRLIDAAVIAYGGAVATCTTVDILGTQATSSVKLVAAAQASLTQSAVLRAGEAGAAVLADGASFVANDASKAITIGKTGSDCATATGIDVVLTYTVEP